MKVDFETYDEILEIKYAKMKLMFFLSKYLQFLLQNQWCFRRWVGDRCNDLNLNTEKLQFQVRKNFRNILKGDLSCQVIIIGCDSIDQESCYIIKSLAGKSAFKITEDNGKLAAEVSLFWPRLSIT